MRNFSRTEYSVFNIFASMFGYMLNIILSFICRIIFVRCLNAEYLGLNGMFSNILSILSLTELGIGTAMIYSLYKPISENNHDKISAYMRVYGIAYKVVGIVIGLTGILLMPFLEIIIGEAPNIPENIYLLYLLYLFSTASSYFFSYKSSIIIANQRNYVVLAISYFFVILQNLVQIIILIVFKNYILYLITQVIFTLLTNIFISIKADKDYPYIRDKSTYKLSKSEKWTLIKNIKALTITKLSGILVNNTDNIVITYFNGLIATGIVSNYLLITNMLTSLTNQIFNSLSASLGNLNAESDNEHKYTVFKSLNLINFWIYAWATIGIIVLSSDIVKLFFGFEYVMKMEIPLILGINFYMVGMLNVVSLYKSTMGLFKYGQYVLLFTAFFNLIGDIILGSKYGILGIFVATAIARTLTNVWYEPYVIFKHGFKRKINSYILRYFFYLVILIVTGLITYILCSFVKINYMIGLLIKLLICIVIPNCIFVLVFHNFPEFKYIFDSVRGLLSKFNKMKKGTI